MEFNTSSTRSITRYVCVCDVMLCYVMCVNIKDLLSCLVSIVCYKRTHSGILLLITINVINLFRIIFTVALLARNTGCSLEDKVKFVQGHIYPQGVVKYIVLDGDRNVLRKLGEAQEDEGEEDNDGNIQSNFGVAADYADEFSLANAYTFPLGGADWSELSSARINNAQSNIRNYPYGVEPGQQGSLLETELGVMHVSTSTGFALLDLLLQQKPETKASGGPRIILDGGWRVGNRTVILWMAISALLSACACTFLLVVHNGSVLWFQQDEEPQNQPPQRPRRRRLTREQVRRMLPPYIFDGTELVCHPTYPYANQSQETPPNAILNPSEGSLTEGLLESVASAGAGPSAPDNVELHCCSICLDDYEAGMSEYM